MTTLAGNRSAIERNLNEQLRLDRQLTLGPVGPNVASVTSRRLAILDAAARLISRQGFAHTSVEDVIREAGLSGKSHFYHYFESKQVLGYEVLERQFARFAEGGLAILREPMIEPVDRLALFIDTLVALQGKREGRDGSPFGNLAGELADSHEGFRERLGLVFDRWAQQLEALLWELRDRLRDGVEPARLARFIIASLEGGMMMARVKRDVTVMQGIGEDLKRFVAMHLREGALPVATLAGHELDSPAR